MEMNKTKQKQSYTYREQSDGFQRGKWLEDWVKKVKGLSSSQGKLQNSHWEGEACEVQHREYSQW